LHEQNNPGIVRGLRLLWRFFQLPLFNERFSNDTSMKPNFVTAILFALWPCHGADARARLACDGLRGERNRYMDT
jgi:hypothetical protein